MSDRQLWHYVVMPFGAEEYEDLNRMEALEEAVVGALESEGVEVVGVTYRAYDGQPQLTVYSRKPIPDEADAAVFKNLDPELRFSTLQEIPD